MKEKRHNQMNDTEEEILQAHTGLIYSVARIFFSQQLDQDELFQAGRRGLLKAFRKFDPNKGNFANYARRAMRSEMSRQFRGKREGTQQLSSYLAERLPKVLRVEGRLIQKLQRDPTVQEIVAELHRQAALHQSQTKNRSDTSWITEENIRLCLLSTRPMISLDRDLSDEANSAAVEEVAFTAESSLRPVEDTVDQSLASQSLLRYLAQLERKTILRGLPLLSERERTTLVLRFGYDYTLEEIGQMYGITREAVRQTQVRALKKLHHPEVTLQLRKILESFTK